MPHGESRQRYKNVLGGRARGVFRGRVLVRPDAQKTNAEQSSASILLAEGAEIDAKPQLEIWADDVKCSHGATIGRLDENALFYLRSRGIGEAAARDLLVQGFAAEVLASLPSPRAGRGARRSCCASRCAARGRGRPGREARRRAPARGLPDPAHAARAASRWCSSTAPPARRSRARCSTPCSASTRRSYANVHRGVYELSERATQAFEGVRSKVRALHRRRRSRARSSSCAAPPRRSTWSRTGIARTTLGPGDEVLITELEHHSNIVPWQMACQERGAKLRVVGIDDRGDLRLDELDKLLGPRTKLLALAHVSNALGTVNPVREIVEARARARRARCCSTARRRCRTRRWTCARWAATSTPSPRTSCSARPASACSTAAPSSWRRCRPTRAAAT